MALPKICAQPASIFWSTENTNPIAFGYKGAAGKPQPSIRTCKREAFLLSSRKHSAQSGKKGHEIMDTIVISCKTVENELLAVMKELNCGYTVHWLESALHNVPMQLNARLQSILDSCGEYDTALFAMSYCGNSLIGLYSGNHRLVIPRCDDCITLLLGSVQRRQSISATYFMTEGWLSGEHNLWWEYQHCIDKYGEKRGRRIFSVMLAHYKNLALLDTGCFDKNAAQAQMLPMAQTLGLEYTCIEGTLHYLQDLLNGNWDESRFLIVPPHTTISADMLTLKG